MHWAEDASMSFLIAPDDLRELPERTVLENLKKETPAGCVELL